MPPSQALYYSWIDIRDEAWLKTSLLYWDTVRTIVPESIETPYSSETGRALQQAGFLVPLREHSSMEEIEELTGDALTYLTSCDSPGQDTEDDIQRTGVQSDHRSLHFQEWSRHSPTGRSAAAPERDLDRYRARILTMTDTVTLYRPVGPEELTLIRQSGWRRFPPRLPGQPIFYPVLQEDYAVRIARDWNVPESGAGFVTRFSVAADYLSRYEVHEVGGRQCSEYWIPAESLPEFNDHIEGLIEVVAEFHGAPGEARQQRMGEWVKVYDLAEDQETIHLIQKATLTTEDFGLVPEIALFGSDEWWWAIQDGRIPHHELEGVITRVFMSGHGDWPEFEIEASGEKSRWTRLGPDALYRVGNGVRLEYVFQKARKHWLGSREQKQVLRIFVKATAQAPATPPAPVPSATA